MDDVRVRVRARVRCLETTKEADVVASLPLLNLDSLALLPKFFVL